MTYYVVYHGRVPGVYEDWEDLVCWLTTAWEEAVLAATIADFDAATAEERHLRWVQEMGERRCAEQLQRRSRAEELELLRHADELHEERHIEDMEILQIFSELDETKAQGLIFHGMFQNTEGETERGHEVATPAGGAAKGGAPLWCGPLGTPPTPPFRLYILLVAKTLNRQVIFHEEFRSRRHREAKFGGQKSLFRHAAGTGNCPRNPSPSTPPPSSSPLLSPMMRRE
ncbi:hypothetical protein QYE76_063323 [Lolium multiflorum]|uniref:Ribonuclease H1 N-terminal domain-containing protein n=1 Tax=Lolium multiflorum TaxID=4521 RepID=A0AAD8S5H4_LOLMU|nr:hypothetical protein QYE76_063323 [Lolium multiflorum]